jgi:hypothetical protein
MREPRLSRELARLADARNVHDVHCASLQPCPNPDERSQDRYVVQDWEVAGAGDGVVWRFMAVLDGEFLSVSFVELRITGYVWQDMQARIWQNTRG